MEELAELRKLKIEETALIKMLELLKKQHNRLKIEELTLASKIREKVYADIATTSSACTTEALPLNTIDVDIKPQMTSDTPEDVNKLHLNLSTASGVPVPQLQPLSGGMESNEEDYYESEEEEEDAYDEDPLASFLDC